MIRIGLLGILFNSFAHAGLPEPGLLLYGQIRDGTGTLITTGDVTWTWTPESGGETVTFTAPLDANQLDGDLYSYLTVVPFESDALGVPGSAAAMDVTGDHAVYRRTAVVEPYGLVYQDRVTVSTLKRAGWERIDIVPGNAWHSMDANRDGNFDLGDILQLIELYAGYPGMPNLFHEYHCTPDGGYAPGPGPRNCMRHAGDYRLESEPSVPGTPYELDLLELLRLIELYQTDLGDHSYCRDWGNAEDGFRGGSCAKSHVIAAPDGTPDITMTRTLQPVIEENGVFLHVTITAKNAGDGNATAVGLLELLPPGWTFDQMVDGVAPIMTPQSGQGQILEFAWLGSPQADTAITYRLAMPSAVSLLDEIAGEAVYRGTDIGAKMSAVQGPGRLAATLDRDGDGILDIVEMMGLHDEGHRAPGTMQLQIASADADNDGQPDLVEAVDLYGAAGIDEVAPALGFTPRDTDGDGTPDHLDTDSDNDGASDSDERTLGTDPYNVSSPTSMPVSGFGVLIALGLAGVWRTRRVHNRK